MAEQGFEFRFDTNMVGLAATLYCSLSWNCLSYSLGLGYYLVPVLNWLVLVAGGGYFISNFWR